MRTTTRWFSALAVLVLACTSPKTDHEAARHSAGGASASAAPVDPAEPVEDRQEAAELQAAFVMAKAREQDLTFDTLSARHSPPFLAKHGLEVRKAAHYEEFAKTFALSDAERAKLDQLGFVVVPARKPGGAGPVDLYYRVFAADLPVFVSADSVLHAWHRSYDAILQSTELETMFDRMSGLLEAIERAIDKSEPGAEDARVYVQVARALLLGESEQAPARSKEVEALVAAVRAEQRATVQFMGNPVDIDFSQFKPRGHYTAREPLERYFRAMSWLGLVDLRLVDELVDVKREEAAARALVSALSRSGRKSAYEAFERFYRAHVGRPNALSPVDLAGICEQAGAPGCAGAKAAQVDLKQHYLAQGAASYGGAANQQTVSLRLLPKRFAYDAWVTAKLTSPRLPSVVFRDPETSVTSVSARLMASPFDVAFALGSERALTQLEGEGSKPYGRFLSQHLAATRATMLEHSPVELDATLYNRWLAGLMAAAKTDVREELPRVMQTAAWHDHKLETVLASWAELRHDTVLMVEQSGGTLGCQYPKGYVEPVPELYRQLAKAASELAALYADEKDSARARTITAWSKHYGDVMQRLARLSEQQLRGEPMNAADLAFMNRTVDQHAVSSYLGDRSYDGWYPALFYSADWTNESRAKVGTPSGPHPHSEGGESEPIVVDVHTDTDHNLALQVATGHPELMIVAIDQGGDLSLYGGPVASFYSFEQPSNARMTDREWKAAIRNHELPSRPAFARGYRAE